MSAETTGPESPRSLTIPTPPPGEQGTTGTGTVTESASPGGTFHWAPNSRKPNLTALIVILAFSFMLSVFLQTKPSDAGIANANIQNIAYESGDWKCINEDFSNTELMQQLGADSYTLRQYVKPAYPPASPALCDLPSVWTPRIQS
jgi:hypothetical protein